MPTAKPAGPNRPDPWYASLWDRFEQWAAELEVPFERVVRVAAIADPRRARASRARMRKGEAPEVRRALFDALRDLERKRTSPTETGRLIAGVEEWAALGRRLAAVDPQRFLAFLDRLRDAVAAAERSHEAMLHFTDDTE